MAKEPIEWGPDQVIDWSSKWPEVVSYFRKHPCNGIDLLHFDDFTIDSICHGEYNLKRNFKRQLNILKGVSSSSCLNVSFQSENGGLMGPFSLFLDPDDWNSSTIGEFLSKCLNELHLSPFDVSLISLPSSVLLTVLPSSGNIESHTHFITISSHSTQTFDCNSLPKQALRPDPPANFLLPTLALHSKGILSHITPWPMEQLVSDALLASHLDRELSFVLVNRAFVKAACPLSLCFGKRNSSQIDFHQNMVNSNINFPDFPRPQPMVNFVNNKYNNVINGFDDGNHSALLETTTKTASEGAEGLRQRLQALRNIIVQSSPTSWSNLNPVSFNYGESAMKMSSVGGANEELIKQNPKEKEIVNTGNGLVGRLDFIRKSFLTNQNQNALKNKHSKHISPVITSDSEEYKKNVANNNYETETIKEDYYGLLGNSLPRSVSYTPCATSVTAAGYSRQRQTNHAHYASDGDIGGRGSANMQSFFMSPEETLTDVIDRALNSRPELETQFASNKYQHETSKLLNEPHAPSSKRALPPQPGISSSVPLLSSQSPMNSLENFMNPRVLSRDIDELRTLESKFETLAVDISNVVSNLLNNMAGNNHTVSSAHPHQSSPKKDRFHEPRPLSPPSTLMQTQSVYVDPVASLPRSQTPTAVTPAAQRIRQHLRDIQFTPPPPDSIPSPRFNSSMKPLSASKYVSNHVVSTSYVTPRLQDVLSPSALRSFLPKNRPIMRRTTTAAAQQQAYHSRENDLTNEKYINGNNEREKFSTPSPNSPSDFFCASPLPSPLPPRSHAPSSHAPPPSILPRLAPTHAAAPVNQRAKAKKSFSHPLSSRSAFSSNSPRETSKQLTTRNNHKTTTFSAPPHSVLAKQNRINKPPLKKLPPPRPTHASTLRHKFNSSLIEQSGDAVRHKFKVPQANHSYSPVGASETQKLLSGALSERINPVISIPVIRPEPISMHLHTESSPPAVIIIENDDYNPESRSNVFSSYPPAFQHHQQSINHSLKKFTPNEDKKIVSRVEQIFGGPFKNRVVSIENNKIRQRQTQREIIPPNWSDCDQWSINLAVHKAGLHEDH